MGEDNEIQPIGVDATGQKPEDFKAPTTGIESLHSRTPAEGNQQEQAKQPAPATEDEQRVHQEIRAFTSHYLEQIPEAERTLSTPEETRSAEELMWQALEGGSHLYSASDRLANLPQPIREAANLGDAQTTARLMREFSDNPYVFAPQTDKLKNLADSPLPPSVRDALISLATQAGGEYSPASLFRVAATEIEKGTSIGAALEQAQQVASSRAVRETDTVRQVTASRLLETLYPEIADRVKAAFSFQAGATQVEVAPSTAESIEGARIEAKVLSDIGYFHVEDDIMMADVLQDQLTESGMKGPLGSATSLEQAQAKLRELVSSGSAPDVVLLDRTFPEGDQEMPSKRSSGKLLEFIDALAAENEQLRRNAEHMKVVIVSGAIDPDELGEIQKRYPRVVGAVAKGLAMRDQLRAELMRTGIAKAE